MIIHHNDYIYTIEELSNESKEINYERCNKIIEYLEKKYTLAKAELLSNKYIYKKYYNCEYI